MDEGLKKELYEWVKAVVIALAAVIIIKIFLFDIMPISQVSMQPTLFEADRVYIDILGYRVAKPEYSHIVVFKPPIDKNSYYIKRIIAIPGETIKIQNGKVYINDKELQEIYLPKATYTDGEMELEIPEGMVFVMGDNRSNSRDSREFGPIFIKSIRGHSLFRVYPFNRIKKL